MYKLINTVQHYPWGSVSAIPDILNIKNSEQKPYAELWLGDHNRAISKVIVDEKVIPLDKLIKKNPELILGKGKLKLLFLLKILAAAKPLSIQLHPTKIEAEEGFKKENIKNIPIDAPYRNYKDNNHKPEIICAISPFTALKGFRSKKDIYDNFSRINSNIIKNDLKIFNKNQTEAGLKVFFSSILNLSDENRDILIKEAKITVSNSDTLYNSWLLKFIEEYGNDIGVFASLFLNIVILEPGEALFIKAGELHAYLSGTGIELMASSDNVLRGGLTKKHIDKEELLLLTNFSESETEKVKIKKKSNGEEIYITEVDDFQLSRIVLRKSGTFNSDTEKKAKIIICLEGEFILSNPENNKLLQITKGESVLIPAINDRFNLKGQGIIFKAT